MPAAPLSIEDRLASAWAFLRGRHDGFHPAPLVPERAAPQAGHHLLLPIGRLDRPDRAAVGLVIDRGEAEAVASAMFALPRESLTDEDVADACAEACNVLSGCVVDLLRPTSSGGLDLGLPRAVAADAYEAVSLASRLLALYELEGSGAPSCADVRLVVYDPVQGPWGDDSSRPAGPSPAPSPAGSSSVSMPRP